VPSMTTTSADLARAAQKLRHAQLADMKEGDIIAYLRSKGYTVSPRPFGARLLAPLADEDEEMLPFVAERDGRYE
jgi:hypothetical protein